MASQGNSANENGELALAYLYNQMGAARSSTVTPPASSPRQDQIPSISSKSANKKCSKKRKKAGGAKHDAGLTKPKRPMSAYNYFFKAEHARILQHNVKQGIKATFEQVAKLIGARWKSVTQDELSTFEKRAKDDAERYKIAMNKFYDDQNEMRRAKYFKRTPDDDDEGEVKAVASAPKSFTNVPSSFTNAPSSFTNAPSTFTNAPSTFANAQLSFSDAAAHSSNLNNNDFGSTGRLSFVCAPAQESSANATFAPQPQNALAQLASLLQAQLNASMAPVQNNNSLANLLSMLHPNIGPNYSSGMQHQASSVNALHHLLNPLQRPSNYGPNAVFHNQSS